MGVWSGRRRRSTESVASTSTTCRWSASGVASAHTAVRSLPTSCLRASSRNHRSPCELLPPGRGRHRPRPGLEDVVDVEAAHEVVRPYSREGCRHARVVGDRARGRGAGGGYADRKPGKMSACAQDAATATPAVGRQRGAGRDITRSGLERQGGGRAALHPRATCSADSGPGASCSRTTRPSSSSTSNTSGAAATQSALPRHLLLSMTTRTKVPQAWTTSDRGLRSNPIGG